MSARKELALSKRRSHLVELVRRRMDCENPKRRVVRLLRALSVLFLLFFGLYPSRVALVVIAGSFTT